MQGFLDFAREHGPYVYGGVKTTLALTGAAMAIALILGLVIALAYRSRLRILSLPAYLFVEVARSIPLLVVLFIFYFGIASMGVLLSPFTSAVLTFGLVGAAYMAEIYRAGINAVDSGQTDAARAVGMTYPTTMRRIVLPQAFRIILPAVANETLTMLKATAVVLTIGVADITFRAYDVSATTFRSMEILIIAGLVYMSLAIPMSLLIRWLERRMATEFKEVQATELKEA